MTKRVKRKPNLAILEGGIFWNKGLFWKLCQITWLNKNNRQCICIKPSCCFCYLVMNCFLYMMLMTLTNWKYGICWVQSPEVKRDYFNLSQFRAQPLLDCVHIFVQTRYSLWLSGRAKPTGTWRVQIHDFSLFRPTFKHTEIIIYRMHKCGVSPKGGKKKSLLYSVMTVRCLLHGSFRSFHTKYSCENRLYYL